MEMGSRNTISKIAAIFFLSAALIGASCTQPSTNSNNANANQSNTNAQAGHQTALPANLTDSPYPGFKQAGPEGNVSLRFTAPQANQAIQGNSVAPTFDISGYPIYMDSARNKGQHIHVIIDNEPYEADYNPMQPFTHTRLQNLQPGTHTIRAFPSREWHESIKQPAGAFAMQVFNVGQASVTDINATAPLLTYSRPKGDYKWEDHPSGVMLDFYLTNATLGATDHKVRYTLSKDGKQVKSETLTQWQPVWWPWSELQEGEYTVLLELLDKDNKPVPFKVGNLDYNRTERTFKIGPKDGAPPAGNANANTSANRNQR
jgi:hypothetical protein